MVGKRRTWDDPDERPACRFWTSKTRRRIQRMQLPSEESEAQVEVDIRDRSVRIGMIQVNRSTSSSDEEVSENTHGNFRRRTVEPDRRPRSEQQARGRPFAPAATDGRRIDEYGRATAQTISDQLQEKGIVFHPVATWRRGLGDTQPIHHFPPNIDDFPLPSPDLLRVQPKNRRHKFGRGETFLKD